MDYCTMLYVGLGYCNKLYVVLPLESVWKLQQAEDAAVRLLTGTSYR